MDEQEIKSFLEETEAVRYRTPHMQEFISGIPVLDVQRDQAVTIYEYVRDAFLYDPYHLDLRPDYLISEIVVGKKRAWCVEKALVAVAVFRAFQIPARFGFGIVKNHIGVEKLTQYLKREEIVFHGFTEVLLDGKWAKCTPAFDPRICHISGVPVLKWDGREDSLFQPFSGENRFMEYIHFYGSFADIPFELMHREMYRYYPHLFHHPIDTKAFSFHFDPQFIPELLSSSPF